MPLTKSREEGQILLSEASRVETLHGNCLQIWISAEESLNDFDTFRSEILSSG